MPTPEQFQELTAKLKILVEKDKEQKGIALQNLLCQFKDSVAKIRLHYQRVIETYQRDIIPFLQSHS